MQMLCKSRFRMLGPLGVVTLLLLTALSSSHGPTANPGGESNPGASRPGRSATLLSEGRWLFVGGEGPAGPLASAIVWDPQTETLTMVSQPLQVPRAGHSATVLPDGAVLLFGGVGTDGQIVDRAEARVLPIHAASGSCKSLV
jgi:hypothetical protein